MKNRFKIMNIIQKYEKVAVLTASAVIGIVLVNKLLLNKGFTYEKMLKGTDICSLMTNIETLAIKSKYAYEMAYNPDESAWYLIVKE